MTTDTGEQTWKRTPGLSHTVSCKQTHDQCFLFQNLDTRANLALASQFTALDYITVREEHTVVKAEGRHLVKF